MKSAILLGDCAGVLTVTRNYSKPTTRQAPSSMAESWLVVNAILAIGRPSSVAPANLFALKISVGDRGRQGRHGDAKRRRARCCRSHNWGSKHRSLPAASPQRGSSRVKRDMIRRAGLGLGRTAVRPNANAAAISRRQSLQRAAAAGARLGHRDATLTTVRC
jgi:hypothetical protein